MTRDLKIRWFLFVCLCSLILVGCENRDNESGKAGSAEARALISLVKGDLDKTKRELTDLKHDLQGVIEVQNEFAEQIKQLVTANQEKVPSTTEVAGPDIKKLIIELNEQRQNIGRLENRITQLGVLVKNLQTSITEQQTTINDLVSIIEEQAVINEQENIEPQDDIDY